MSESGQRWARATIGDLIALDYGRALADSVRSGDGYPVYGSSGLVGHNSKALVDGPGIVVGRKGTVGAVTWSPRRFWPIDTTYYVRWLDEKLVDRRWTYWFLSTLPLKRLDSSTGVPGLNRNDAYRLSVRLPPIAEQRRIAEILDTADKTIRTTERLIAKLEQTKQGLIHDLLTCGIDKSGHLRDPHRHPENFWNSVLGLIPADWQVVSCDKLCEHIVVGIVVKPTQYYVAEGVPILRSANVREGGIDMSDLKFMSRQSHELLRKSSVRPGDVLTVRTGYPGTSAVITDDVGDANCVDVIISRPNCAIKPNFLALWVNSPFGKDQVLAGQGGLAQQHFNIGQMKKLSVAVPDLEEQRVITEIVSSWEARVHAASEELEKLRVMKRGLMDDLLTGRVRVGASA
jgi:type I restriction enzyme S subunit